MIKTKKNCRPLQLQVHQRIYRHCHAHDILILERLQISLCDVDILVPQKLGERIHIQPISQVALGVIVPGCMGRAANLVAYL